MVLRGRVSQLPGNRPGWPKIVRVENLLRILLRIRLAEIVRVENRPRVENPTENLDDSQPGRFSANPDGHRGVG